MNFDTQPSPARVTAAAAMPFPRLALWTLLVVYIGSGLFGRDPWYQEDAAGFGVMWTMAHGTWMDWWLPNVQGEFIYTGGPLAYWVGAIFIRLFGGWIGDVNAARLATAAWFFGAIAVTWYSTYRLARRDEALPVAFAFGGEARPRDYARMLADIAVLLFIATLGLVLRIHETTDLIGTIALVGLTLYGLVVGLARPAPGAWWVGGALGLLALMQGAVLALFVALGALAAMGLLWPRQALAKSIAVALLLACALASLWLIGAMSVPTAAYEDYLGAWWWHAHQALVPVDIADLSWLLRTIAWYEWPLWPFALWAIYAWRHRLRRAHIATPTALLLTILALALLSPQTELPLVMAALPLAVLGAFGAISLRRALESAIDWFAIVAFSCVMLIAWGYFIAMETGTPPKMADSIARLAPGYVPHIGPFAIAAAVLISAAWIGLVIWRTTRHPAMMWRGPLLAAGGLIAHWFLLNALFLPSADYKRSYRPLAQEIHKEIQSAAPAACVYPFHLLPAHRAMLAYHGDIKFGSMAECPLALHRDSKRSLDDDPPPPGAWTRIWEGHWPGRPDEFFYLYRRER